MTLLPYLDNLPQQQAPNTPGTAENIRGTCAAITLTVLRNVRKRYVNRIRMFRQQDGNQFEQFLQ
ncbi:hypothetical protein C0J52_16673 [Blattella germanica]|nr:hypothetical protein C0J52_16673 [Blattella germanica]